MGNHTQVMLDAVTAMKGIIESGQVRALGTTGQKRSGVLPDVPAIAETVPGYEATLWLGIMAPKGTPQEVVDRLSAEIAKVIAKPAIQEAWTKQGAVAMSMTPAEFGEFLKRDIDKWAKVIDQAGLKPQ